MASPGALPSHPSHSVREQVRGHCVLAFLHRVLRFVPDPPAYAPVVSGANGGVVLVDGGPPGTAVRLAAAHTLDGVVDGAGLSLAGGEAAVVVAGSGRPRRAWPGSGSTGPGHRKRNPAPGPPCPSASFGLSQNRQGAGMRGRRC